MTSQRLQRVRHASATVHPSFLADHRRQVWIKISPSLDHGGLTAKQAHQQVGMNFDQLVRMFGVKLQRVYDPMEGGVLRKTRFSNAATTGVQKQHVPEADRKQQSEAEARRKVRSACFKLSVARRRRMEEQRKQTAAPALQVRGTERGRRTLPEQDPVQVSTKESAAVTLPVNHSKRPRYQTCAQEASTSPVKTVMKAKGQTAACMSPAISEAPIGPPKTAPTKPLPAACARIATPAAASNDASSPKKAATLFKPPPAGAVAMKPPKKAAPKVSGDGWKPPMPRKWIPLRTIVSNDMLPSFRRLPSLQPTRPLQQCPDLAGGRGSRSHLHRGRPTKGHSLTSKPA
mmetsp:Transcript_51760/g.123177  ORF Transcript_51760/g.123177 Transcript_51760/m.123177 type:complete len:345 (+) Transcript_51760:47-1081(+)